MSDSYLLWAERHATLFALTTPQDSLMLAEWVELFKRAGFTPQELNAATDHLALHSPPRWRGEHLREIEARVRQGRIERVKPPQDEPDCLLCGGTGYVSGLPLLSAVVNGVWVNPMTCAVFCRCGLGQWRDANCQPADPNAPRRLNYDAYTHHLPDWRDVVAARAELLRSRDAARRSAGTLDRELGEILRKANAPTEDW